MAPLQLSSAKQCAELADDVFVLCWLQGGLPEAQPCNWPRAFLGLSSLHQWSLAMRPRMLWPLGLCLPSLTHTLPTRIPPVTKKTYINSVQARCIAKGEAQKNPLFWMFSGGFLIFPRSPILTHTHTDTHTHTPCKSTCLYNAPSMTLLIIC